jgi:hypothetical protein
LAVGKYPTYHNMEFGACNFMLAKCVVPNDPPNDFSHGKMNFLHAVTTIDCPTKLMDKII